MDKHLALYFIGIFIVFASHIYMGIVMPDMRAHAAINIVAALCIAYYFMHKEGYISF